MHASLLFRSAAILAAAAVPLAALEAQDPDPDDKPIVIGPVRPAPAPPPIPPNLAARAIPSPLLDGIGKGVTADRYLETLEKELTKADQDADGLDQADIVQFRLANEARQRVDGLSRVMPYDLNGDYEVTLAEIERNLTSNGIVRQAEAAHELERFDKDHDGVISFDEAAHSQFRASPLVPKLEALLAMDPDPADKLTLAELDEQARAAFRIVDRDGDGTISDDEDAAIYDQRYVTLWLRYEPACPLPAAPNEAQVVVFGAWQGQAVSSAAVGGLDQATDLIDVKISPGTKPLYLILTSRDSVIWRIGGSVDRVVHAVIHSNIPVTPEPGSAIVPEGQGMSASGVIGLPAGSVTVVPTGCLPENDSPFLAQIERGIGRPADKVLSARYVQAVALPSGRVTERPTSKPAELPEGFDAWAWRQAGSVWPAGLAQVDPAEIVAAGQAEAYTVLPGKMGVSQLAGSGALVKQPNGAYLITRPIPHFPARLEGYHYTMMILPRGMPMPQGIPPRCLIHEELMPAQGPICPGRPPPPPATRKSKP